MRADVEETAKAVRSLQFFLSEKFFVDCADGVIDIIG